MNSHRSISSPEAGSILIFVVFLLIVLIPILMGLTRWTRQTRDQNLFTRAHVGSDSAADSARDIVRFNFSEPGLIPSSAGTGFINDWKYGASGSYEVRLDSSTTVELTVEHEGYR